MAHQSSPFGGHNSFLADIAVLPKAPVDENDPTSPSLEKMNSGFRGRTHADASETDTRRPTWKPVALEWWSTIPLGLTFIVLAIASEVVLFYSQNNSGFNIHLTDSALSRGKQFIKSFGPSLIFALLFLWFASSYDAIKLLQPYIDMSHHQGAEAQKSVLIDYSAKGPTSAFFLSLKKHHWIVSILSSIAVLSGVFTALAGSYFQIISVPQHVDGTVNISGAVGYGYANVTNIITPFMIAAATAENSFLAGVLYSSNVFRDAEDLWMIPSFTLADSGASAQAGNITAKLGAVVVHATCTVAQSVTVSGPDAQGFYEILGTLPNNCSATSYAYASGIGTWFGWVVTAPFECVQGIDPNQTIDADPGTFFTPVAFSFFKTKSIYSMVFCSSTLVEHNVVAKLGPNPNNRTISNVSDQGVVRSLGWGPNGFFPPNLANDSRATSLADGIRFVLCDAIMEYAGHKGVAVGTETSGHDTVLSNSSLVAQYAREVYQLYQAFAAPSTLVVGPTYVQNATYDIQTYRLVANKSVARALTVLCALTGLTLFALFLHHHMSRQEIWLGAEPSGIATVAALLSKSKFTTTTGLHPSDSIEQIEKKLDGLYFKLLDDGTVDLANPPEKA